MAVIANGKWHIETDDAKVVVYSHQTDTRFSCSRNAAWDLKDLLEKVLSIPERSE